MITELFTIISYFVIGAGLKYIDTAFDTHFLNKKVAVFLGIIVGILMGYLMLTSIYSATILFAIIFAVAIMKKIDDIASHIVVVIVILMVTISAPSFAFMEINWVLWGILVLIFVLDEIMDDIFVDKIERKGTFLRYFFYYICFGKIAVIIFWLLGLMPLLYAIAWIAFDIGYVATEEYVKRVYGYGGFK